MLLTPNFKDVIASHFYDKEVTVLEATETDDTGWVKKSWAVKGTFNGNVRFNNLGEVQSELGISDNIDIAVTCDTGVEIEGENALEYLDQRYEVTAIRPADSHLLIVGKKWR